MNTIIVLILTLQLHLQEDQVHSTADKEQQDVSNAGDASSSPAEQDHQQEFQSESQERGWEERDLPLDLLEASEATATEERTADKETELLDEPSPSVENEEPAQISASANISQAASPSGSPEADAASHTEQHEERAQIGNVEPQIESEFLIRDKSLLPEAPKSDDTQQRAPELQATPAPPEVSLQVIMP